MKLCVIGLSSFGHELASTLANKGIEVLAVDKNNLKVEAIKDKVTQAICINVESEEALRTVGVDEMDTVILCLGKNFEDAVLLTRLIKEKLEVPRVITRTSSKEKKQILELVGADDVVLPETEAAKILANRILSKFPNQVPLDENYSIINVIAPEDFTGQTVETLNLPQKYNISCIGILREDKIVHPKKDEVLKENDIIYLAGKNKNLSQLLNL